MARLKIPAGSQVFLGAPANPPESSITTALRLFLGSLPAIIESHLVQCHFSTIEDGSYQVIIIVIEDINLVPATVDKVVLWLNEALPEGMSLHVWPMRSSDSLLPLVREANWALVKPS